MFERLFYCRLTDKRCEFDDARECVLYRETDVDGSCPWAILANSSYETPRF